MRGKILKLLSKMMLIFLILIIPINYKIRITIAKEELKKESHAVFWQIDQLTKRSEKNVDQTIEEFADECLNNASIVSYAIQYNPSFISNAEEMRKIAQLLDVDEIHIMDESGVIYAGTNPEYYQLSIKQMERMQFFLPILENRSRKLCEKIAPQLEDSNAMQYAAVWRPDGKGIVLVGVSPQRISEVIDSKSLASTLALIPEGLHGNLYIADSQYGFILNSSEVQYIGKYIGRVIEPKQLEEGEVVVRPIRWNGASYYVVAEKNGEYIYLNAHKFTKVLHPILIDSMFLLSYLILLSIIIVYLVVHYMDQKLVKGLESIVFQLGKIEEGHLTHIHIDTDIPEFISLKYYINKMLQGMFSSFERFSTILEKSNIPIGVYEYNTFYNRAFANKYLFEILRIRGEEGEQSQYSLTYAAQQIHELKQHPENAGENIYRLVKGEQVYYIQLEELFSDQSEMIWVMDVSQLWGKMETLKNQRDTDVLTNLYNRRAFYEISEKLFQQKEKLGCAAIVLIDADHLKYINDVFGHHQGDRYLESIAKILLTIDTEHTICARLGGDEFTILLYGYDTQEQLQKALESIDGLQDTRCMEVDETTRVPIQFSYGYAIYPEDGVDHGELMHHADERMYQNKKMRKEQYGADATNRKCQETETV